MSLHDLFQAMYDSRLGTALAESLYVYPMVEGIHLLSLAFSFGLIVLVDLHLLGCRNHFTGAIMKSANIQDTRPSPDAPPPSGYIAAAHPALSVSRTKPPR
jgi:hypothetical protein